MVIFEQILRDLIIKTNLFERRVFLLQAPQVPSEQVAYPYAIMLPVGHTPWRSMNAALTLRDAYYQISIFDPSQTKALALADSLRLALDSKPRFEYEGVIFHAVFFRSQTQDFESDTKLFHVMPEFRFLYRMTADAQPQTIRRNTRSTTRFNTH